MKISITGASGFVGRALLDPLLQQGHDLTILSRKADPDLPSGVSLLRGDLVAADCPLDQFVADCEVIYHCAGEIRDETRMRPLHVDATQRLLDAAFDEASKTGRNIHWVQLSSVGVYGPPENGQGSDRSVTENTKINPVGEYETTKSISDERVIKACGTGAMSFTILRPSNVFGKDMPNQSLRGMGAMIRRGLFFYIGRPGAIATYVHLDDVVAVLLRCALEARARGKIYNISNDCGLEEMVQGIATALGVSAPRLRLPEDLVRFAVWAVGSVTTIPLTLERVNALVSRTNYPTNRLQQELGYVFQKNVPESIREVL